MENRIQAHRRNQAHPAAPTGMRQFHPTVGLVTQHGDGDVRQPPQRTTRIIRRAHWARVLCLSPRRSPICGVGAGTLRKGKTRGRVFQGGVTTRVGTTQCSPRVLTARLRLEARGSRGSDRVC